MNIEELKALLRYDTETGTFTWIRSGKKAGSKNGKGYIQIGINDKLYYAHRLAYLYMTGKMPEVIDHVNRKKNDNSWENLRNGTQAENVRNKEGVTLLKGVALKEACRLANVSYTTVRERMRKHKCTAEEAMRIPPLKIGGDKKESFTNALSKFRENLK